MNWRNVLFVIKIQPVEFLISSAYLPELVRQDLQRDKGRQEASVKQTYREQTCGCQGGGGQEEGRIGSLGFTVANY